MSHSTPNGAAAPHPGKPAEAAVIGLFVDREHLSENVERLRQLEIGQLDNLAQAVGLATRLREAIDSITAIDDYLLDPYGPALLRNPKP